jgi:hypothetical protein
MPKKLKFVFHVEDEEKNVIVEKSQTWLEFDDETLKSAVSNPILPPIDNYPKTIEGMKAWDKDAGPYRLILEVIQAGLIIMERYTRIKIIEWARKQHEGVN